MVVVGDGAFEVWAGQVMASAGDAEVTIVECTDDPRPEHLAKQLKFAYYAIHDVCEDYEAAHFRLAFSKPAEVELAVVEVEVSLVEVAVEVEVEMDAAVEVEVEMDVAVEVEVPNEMAVEVEVA